MNQVLTTSGWKPTTIVVEDNHPMHHPKLTMTLYGPKGGFRDYLILTPEEAWILGDMLMELAESTNEDSDNR